MALEATLTIAAPALIDNTIWFTNAASWNNYWASVPATVSISAIDTTRYTERTYNTGLSAGAPIMNIAGVDYIVVTKPMFDDLLAMVNNLNDSYKTMRNELRAGGIITNAQ